MVHSPDNAIEEKRGDGDVRLHCKGSILEGVKKSGSACFVPLFHSHRYGRLHESDSKTIVRKI